MDVRIATPADAPIIAQIHVETWRAAYRGQIPDAILDALDVDQRTTFWEKRLAEPQRPVFVSDDDEVVQGFCDLIPSRDKDAAPGQVGEIAAIYVLPNHWRKGAGRALCERALAEARTRNHSSVTLWMLGSNFRTKPFYESMGFRLDGATRKMATPDGTELCEVRYRISI
jgi:GNAT superfamily N-acetyltransferase